MEKIVKITFIRFTEDKAYFLTNQGEEIVLSKNLVPDLKEGQILYLKIAENLEEKPLSPETAKAVLEEILNAD